MAYTTKEFISNRYDDFDTTGAVTLEHTATFNALAYVVASKRDKKFITCSGDARVAAVSDCNRYSRHTW